MPSQQQSIDLRLPDHLQERLVQFQHRVWTVKMAEGVLAGILGLLSSYIVVFLLDRVIDSPGWVRAIILGCGAIAGAILIPWHAYRWVWRSRRLVDVARIVGLTHPRVGDRLLGIVELTESHGDGQASAALCRAAIAQVATETRDHNFLASVPHPRHRQGARWCAIVGAVAAALLAVPGAGGNALARWATPWNAIPRYTFAQLDAPPNQLYVPMGEPFSFAMKLQDTSVWTPSRGKGRYDRQAAMVGELADGAYTFDIPPQTEAGTLAIRVGDATFRIPVEPKTRPELMAMVARVELPGYLQHPPQKKDVRGGAVTLLTGSRAIFEATASRAIAQVLVNGDPNWAQSINDTIKSPELQIDAPTTHLIHWKDVVGLSAKEPFQLKIRTIADEAPTLQCRNMPHEKVLLDEEVLSFAVAANDDFGVKRLGVEWSGIQDELRNPMPDQGEYVLTAGGPEQGQLDVPGSFSAKQLGITPQPINVRLFVEDYLPGRERVYSPQYRLYILNPEQHMIWVTEQMERWERQVLEVRDEEQRLHDQNVELSKLSPDELNEPANRRKIAAQASAERANGRRLESLNLAGQELIALATRNDEFNVNTLEKWAQMLQALRQLAENRMPSVGNLLQEAAQAASTPPGAPPAVPQVVDQEEGMRRDEKPKDAQSPQAGPPPSSKGGRLGLATTTLSGPSGGKSNGASPAANKVEEAVAEQAALLEEFNRVMDEISEILQNLQGSTFVKRLKHAARQETELAKSLHEKLPAAFGEVKASLAEGDQSLLQSLRVRQFDTTRDVSLIQEDLEAYFQRTQQGKFQRVFEEMKETRVVSTFKSMSDAVADNQSGETIAEAEYWSDQLDRWAEMLVGPGCKSCGKCPGSKGDSLPPSVVLEVLRVLRAEVDLRELTRATEQSRPAVEPPAFAEQAQTLGKTQFDLHERIVAVIDQVETLQREENRNFNQDLVRLHQAEAAMGDAHDILLEPETGSRAIAAETEAIEALLATRRAGKGGGSGSGTVPGGSHAGGAATEEASALNGVASGLEAESRIVQQATGSVDQGIPEEFRAGLDSYFSELEK